MPEEAAPAAVAAAARAAFANRAPGANLVAAQVFELGGARSYWLVGDRSARGVEALARIRDDGQVLTVATLRAPARDCAAAATGLDEEGARALAARFGGRAPILVHDGPPARDAWLLSSEAGKPFVLATGGGAYERPRPPAP